MISCFTPTQTRWNHIHRTKRNKSPQRKTESKWERRCICPVQCSMRTYTRCSFIHTASAGTGWIHLCVGVNPFNVRILHSLEFLMSLLNWHWHLHSNLCFILALSTPRNICSTGVGVAESIAPFFLIAFLKPEKKGEKKKFKMLTCWVLDFQNSWSCF